MRTFETGATRDTDDNKIDYQGFLSPFALRRFGQYMLKHQVQADGQRRASDNWKRGIPQESYVKSMTRHVVDFLASYENGDYETCDELACAIFFNTQGWLHERYKPSEKPHTVPFGDPDWIPAYRVKEDLYIWDRSDEGSGS